MTLPVGGIGVGGASAAQATPTPAGAERKNEQGEGFERVLLGQLTKTLVDSALPAEGSSAAMTAYKDMLPDAMTEALMSGGGIGLAAALQGEDA